MGTSPSYDNRALNIAISSAIYKGFVTQSKFDLPLSNRSMQTFTLKARNPYPYNNIAERDIAGSRTWIAENPSRYQYLHDESVEILLVGYKSRFSVKQVRDP
jgi:hypothetical protein